MACALGPAQGLADMLGQVVQRDPTAELHRRRIDPQIEARRELHASEDAQLICGENGRIHEINRRGTQLIGLTAATEWVHHSVFDALSAATASNSFLTP